MVLAAVKAICIEKSGVWYKQCAVEDCAHILEPLWNGINDHPPLTRLEQMLCWEVVKDAGWHIPNEGAYGIQTFGDAM